MHWHDDVDVAQQLRSHGEDQEVLQQLQDGPSEWPEAWLGGVDAAAALPQQQVQLMRDLLQLQQLQIWRHIPAHACMFQGDAAQQHVFKSWSRLIHAAYEALTGPMKHHWLLSTSPDIRDSEQDNKETSNQACIRC